MGKEKRNSKSRSTKYSFTAISDYFLDEWSHVVGVGPTSLYIHLLKYCYKDKNLAWPTLKTLSKKMGVSERSLIRYQKILVKYGFIQNIFKRNATSRNNIYQMTLGQDITNLESLPPRVTNCQFDSDKLSSCKVTICHPNNNNLNNNNITTTRDVVVDFKKEKGEEKMQVIRERMKELDFTESFTEKVLKEYPLKKIEEKLELYAGGKVVRNPAGWLMVALKEDYRDPQSSLSFPRRRESSECHEKPGMDSPLGGNEDKKILSREEAIKRIQGIRKNLRAVNQ